jgi:N-acetyl-anhydromuramyl-L-alanine amidase AmpD
VSAHFAVQKDGSIYQCVSLNSGAYHAGSPWNASSIGIEHQGPIGSDWPQPQCIALVNLVDFLVGHYPTIKQIVFHSVISQTHIDPGVNFPQYIVSVWRSIGLDVVTKKTKPT